MDPKMTVFMLINATPAWLRLSRAERNRITEDEMLPLLWEYGIEMRFYDSEAFSGRCSDIAVFETKQLNRYQFFMDALRDSSFFTEPWFTLVDIIPAIEDGYKQFEAMRNNG
ncbi:darcynin family protein [Aestuariispira insulae]|uniref:Darcynin-like uncharacterized protein n=1 Tax=Aestuariispira insulae TaxID=1461337 RepID=A0A3D9HS45_9PROT|nr:darcynin family protein [Aestuariispira insulae]RED52317.1 darcynin-like uncharacterized protein [Aestuariispira insulae]